MSWTEDQIKALGGSLAEIERTLHKILSAMESRPAAPKAPSAPASTPGGATLPNYGKRKGEPIHGAPMADLEYYASGCRKALADQGKRCPEHAQQEKDDRHRLAHGSETCPVCLRSNCRARRMHQGADPMSDEWNDACRECRDYTRTPAPKPEETPTCTFCKGRGTNVAVDAIEADGRLVNPRPAPCMVCDGSGRQPPCEDCGLPSPRCVCGLVPTPGEGST